MVKLVVSLALPVILVQKLQCTSGQSIYVDQALTPWLGLQRAQLAEMAAIVPTRPMQEELSALPVLRQSIGPHSVVEFRLVPAVLALQAGLLR
jgi:hypothetical protein